MILSHAHRFIFLKTRKTGSTSVELALSRLCGPDDVLTPLGPIDEAEREGNGARNYVVPPGKRPWAAWLYRACGKSPEYSGFFYFNHMTAVQVRRLVPRDVWSSYVKVTIERNPWDREVSHYYAQYPPGRRPPFEEYVRSGAWRRPVDNFDIYAIRGRVAADVVLRYESLAEDFRSFVTSLGIAEPPPLGNAKSSRRSGGARDYRAIHTPLTREACARRYAREIAAFGYEF